MIFRTPLPEAITPRCLQLGVLLAGILAMAPDLSAQFTNATLDAGLVYQQMSPFVTEEITHFQTGGAAAGDFDGDGWVDLFVTRVGARDILLRNRGPSGPKGIVGFTDVTNKAGITGVYNSNGAAWADVDNDGDLDLYVTTMYHNRFYLYLNNGDGTFTEQAAARGADLQSTTPHNGFSVAFGDYDRDGFLDFYACEWYISKTVPDLYQHSMLMRNFGAAAPGYFTNRTVAAGVDFDPVADNPNPLLNYISVFTSRFSDLDNDGWPDLLLTADYGTSQIYWNNGDGTFVDEGDSTGTGIEGNGMGSDVADYDGDGLLDWFVTSIRDNRLYRNLGGRQFEDMTRKVGPLPGLANAGWGWGTAFIDYDNDGDLDLVMTNGYEDVDNPGHLVESIDQTTFWRNDDGVYNRVSNELGFTDMEPGKGLLTFDYDNDGDLDVFIANCQVQPILYRNDTVTTNHWLRVNLLGRKSNSRGIGARLELQAVQDGPVKVQEVVPGSHFLGQSEVTAHFGLGQTGDEVYALTVRWPSGRVQTLYHIPVDQEIQILEPATYQEWETRLSPRTLPSLGGKDNDFDLDGFTNFLEYLFATNPRDASDYPDPSRLRPVLSHEGGVIRFRYARPLGALDGKFAYELSGDLVNWVEEGNSVETPETPVALEGNNLWVDVVFPDNGAETRFLRIHATDNAN